MGVFLRDGRGAAAAEMALILPLLLVLLFVTFEGGHFLWNQHKVVKAVRDGARYAGRLPFASYGCDGTIDPDAEAGIKNLTRTGIIASGGTPIIANWQIEEVEVSVTCFAGGMDGIYASNSRNAPVVTVRANAPYPATPVTDVAGVLGFDASGLILRAQAESPVMGL